MTFKCCQKKCCKIISLLFILFALIIGILANINDNKNINQKIVTSVILFFDAMIPILGSAALIKFLLNPCNNKDDCKNKE